ncbi:MAG: glycosyltransferase family 4 protein [Deltaproteobacteria bacterium]|nr:glycosyltransferase family 4 protein [Deltaproteobacteria bacterium]
MARQIVLTANYSPWSRYSGGGQRSTHQLASALARRGNSVTVVYTKSPLEKIKLPEDLPYSVRFASFFDVHSHRRSLLRPLNALTVARAVADITDGKRDVVVHSQGEEGALIPRLKARRSLRFVVTPRYPSYPEALLSGDVSLRCKAALLAFDTKYIVLGGALRKADVCCPTSRSSLNDIHRAFGVSSGKCRVVPNGVAPCFLDVTRRKNAHGGPLLFFGRLAPSKGAMTLIEAIALLGEEAPSVVVIGRGPELPVLKTQAQTLGLSRRIVFEGWKTGQEIAGRLAESSMAVLPSREESFGNAMVEAMAAGTPLITTRVGSIPEVVNEGRTGILVPQDDPRALANAIRTLLRNRSLAETLGKNGREHVMQRFSWAATAARYEAIYDDALREGGPCES